MATDQLQKFLSKLRQITRQSVKERFQEAIRRELDAGVLDMVASNWQQGLKGDKRIGEYRSESYAAMKRLMNPTAGGKVDLIYTGAFSGALFIPQDENIINVDSSDSKRNELVAKYGDDIFDLSNSQEADIIDDAKMMVYEEIFRFLNG